MTDIYAAMEERLGITRADIETNRRGQLSEAQIERIQGQVRTVWALVGCLTFTLYVPAVILGITLGGPYLLALAGGGLLLVLLAIRQSTRGMRKQQNILLEELELGEVSQLEGPLIKQERGGQLGTFLGVEGHLFPIPKNIFEAAPDGEEIVVYYLPRSKQFVGLELLTNQPAPPEGEAS